MKEEKKTITDEEHIELWSKLVKKYERHKRTEKIIKKLISINEVLNEHKTI